MTQKISPFLLKNRISYLLFLLLVSTLCCQKKATKTTVTTPKVTKKTYQIDSFGFTVPIHEKLYNEPTHWKHLFTARNFLMDKCHNASMSIILDNSKRLQELSSRIGDSILIDDLNETAMHARLEAFKTAALRLHDMANIKAITKEEVNDQIKELFDLQDLIALKINTYFSRKEMDSLLNFNEAFINRYDETKE